MKTVTRAQLAASAGVCPHTLRNWIKAHQEHLWSIGMPKGKGALPPNVVEYIVHEYSIDINTK